MRILIPVDISCNKIRYRVNKLLLGYGQRSQHSVYEIDVTLAQLKKIQVKIYDLIEKIDKVHYFPLCGKCTGGRMADGMATVTWPERFYYY
jgi:CRISPR-associated protein Cas2